MSAYQSDPHGSGSMGSRPSQAIFLGNFALVLLALMLVFVLGVTLPNALGWYRQRYRYCQAARQPRRSTEDLMLSLSTSQLLAVGDECLLWRHSRQEGHATLKDQKSVQ